MTCEHGYSRDDHHNRDGRCERGVNGGFAPVRTFDDADLRQASTEALIERQALRLVALKDAMAATRRGRFALRLVRPVEWLLRRSS